MPGAIEVLQFAITCPPGTAKNAAVITDLDMPDRTILHIRVRIPPGPNGLMGFALGSAGFQVIPYGAGQFTVASDEVIEENYTQAIDSGAWQAIMYNTGVFPHTIYVRFTTQLPDIDDGSVGAQPLPTAAISPPAASVPVVNTVTLPTPPVLT